MAKRSSSLLFQEDQKINSEKSEGPGGFCDSPLACHLRIP